MVGGLKNSVPEIKQKWGIEAKAEWDIRIIHHQPKLIGQARRRRYGGALLKRAKRLTVEHVLDFTVPDVQR